MRGEGMTEGMVARRRQRLGGGDPVPLYTFTTDDMLETRIVAGLDEGKFAFPLAMRGSQLLPLRSAAEMALKARIAGKMGHQHPGASAGG